ncbi:MAG: D-Ala-D-Ala carboxypeptidase family metallohydrolase [Azonexus sp.]
MSPRQTPAKPRQAVPVAATGTAQKTIRRRTATSLAPAPATVATKPRSKSTPKQAAPKEKAVRRTAKSGTTPPPPPAASPAPPISRGVSRSASRSATSTVDRKNEPISQFTLANVSHDTRIAPNFLVYELTRSELADRRGIDNHFASDQELRAAIHLAREVLQPIRDKFGSFTPNSVFRGHPLERALKNKPASWLSTSQHSRGEACDIEIVGMSTLALANWAKDNLKAFDQIICECYDPAKGPNSGWVHISLKAPGSGENRRQLLSYIADHGKMVYVPGLRATAIA